MEFKRNCTNCKCEIEYKTKSQYNDAIKKNRTCKKCSNIKNGTKYAKNNKKYSKVCIICTQKHEFSSYTKWKNAKPIEIYRCKKCALSNTHSGKEISDEHKAKLGNAVKRAWLTGSYSNVSSLAKIRWSGVNNPMYNSNRFGKLNPFFNKHHTSESLEKMKNKIFSNYTRDKMSKSAKIRTESNGMNFVNYNPNSIPILEQKAKELGIWDLQHAENGGEYKIKINNKFYFVDGYSKEKNTVIEYYETYHKYNTKNDLKRQYEIEQFLNCKFIIIYE